MRMGIRAGILVLCMVLGAALAATPAFSEEEGFTPIPVIKGIKSIEVGMPAPGFKVKDVDGKPFDFNVERTKRAHILVFWSIFCEPCREEMPVIEKLANEYGPDGKLGVIAVNLDGEPFLDGIKGFVRQNKYTFRIILDELDAKGETFAIADPYQVAGTPVLYLVSAEGKIAGSYLGRIGEGDLKAMIAGMLGGAQ